MEQNTAEIAADHLRNALMDSSARTLSFCLNMTLPSLSAIVGYNVFLGHVDDILESVQKLAQTASGIEAINFIRSAEAGADGRGSHAQLFSHLVNEALAKDADNPLPALKTSTLQPVDVLKRVAGKNVFVGLIAAHTIYSLYQDALRDHLKSQFEMLGVPVEHASYFETNSFKTIESCIEAIFQALMAEIVHAPGAFRMVSVPRTTKFVTSCVIAILSLSEAPATEPDLSPDDLGGLRANQEPDQSAFAHA